MSSELAEFIIAAFIDPESYEEVIKVEQFTVRMGLCTADEMRQRLKALTRIVNESGEMSRKEFRQVHRELLAASVIRSIHVNGKLLYERDETQPVSKRREQLLKVLLTESAYKIITGIAQQFDKRQEQFVSQVMNAHFFPTTTGQKDS